MPFLHKDNVAALVAWASRQGSAGRTSLPSRTVHGRDARATRSALFRSRVALYSTIVPLLLAAAASGLLDHIQRVVLVVVGFSFIIFIHELGHFVVARLCSVRCDVFSIGIGPRMLGWKKGVGFSFGDEPGSKEKNKDKDKHPALEGALTTGDIEQTSRSTIHDSRSTSLGTTDYRISWLPLGGYVRMLGQDDMDPTKISSDPNAFNNRPIWQRMCIVSAGVTMNVILAAIIFMIVFSYGIDFPPAYVGGVVYGSPADRAHLKAGDIITRINGYKPAEGHGFLEFTDVLISSALWTGGDPVKYTIQRGDQPEFTVAIKPERGDNGLMAIGVEYGKSMKLPEFTPAEKAELKGMPNMANFDSGDEIVRVNGLELPKALNYQYPFVEEQLQKSNGNPLTLTVKNTAGVERQVTITPQLSARLGVDEMPNLLGLIPTVTLNGVLPGQPADKAGLKEGDIIARINEREWPSVSQLQESIHKNPGKDISVDVVRDGKVISIPPFKPGFKGDEGYIGIGISPDYDRAAIAGVSPTLSPMPLIVGGSQITAIDGKPVQAWKDVYVYLRDLSANTATTQPASVQVELKEPGSAGATRTISLPFNAAAKEDVGKLTFLMGIQLRNLVLPQQAKTTWAAVLMGMDHTKTFILQTYATLYGLFNNTVPTNQLHGIIGIAKVGHDIQDRGLIWLLYVLGMVSVNLAVANFLPLPIVDGGLFLLLIVEKIRGKPLSMKVQSAIQIVGLCLLGAMFLFVTKNDIGMFFMK